MPSSLHLGLVDDLLGLVDGVKATTDTRPQTLDILERSSIIGGMRILEASKRAAILHSLIEGLGINACARLNGCSKVTVLRLLVDAGEFCRSYHGLHVQKLITRRLQLDEVWSYVGCKQRTKMHGNGKGHGDSWLWVAIDAESRLVVSYHVGGRANVDARRFLMDVAVRLIRRPQITTDDLKAYLPTIYDVFGPNHVDYAVIVKHYANADDSVRTAAARYSPSIVLSVDKKPVLGYPDEAHVSTAYVERSHLELRTHNRRFVRLGIGYSKRLLNHEAAIALHYFATNFMRKHSTLKTTPAVAAGIATHAITPLELVEMIEAEEKQLGGRLTDYLPAA
jgi:IS1 family transposase